MDDLLKKQNKSSRWLVLAGVVFVMPAILFQFFFHWLPVMCAFVVSGQEFRFDGANWVGFENFRKVLEHPESTPLPNWRPPSEMHITVGVCIACLVIGVLVFFAWTYLSGKQRMTRKEAVKGLILRLICLGLMPMLGLLMRSEVPAEADHWLRFCLLWAMTLGSIIFAASTIRSVYSRNVRKYCMWALVAVLAFFGFFVAFFRPIPLIGPSIADLLQYRPWCLSIGSIIVAVVAIVVDRRVDWEQVAGGSINASCLLIGPVIFAVGLCTGLGVAWRNTFLFATMSLGLTFLVPIIVSILLMEMGRRTVKLMMLLWFLPAAGMAGIMIWIYFYQPSGGLLNTLLLQLKPMLEFFGMVASDWNGFRWLGDKQMAMFCLVLPGLVMFGPGLVYIASLHSLPEELYEAAEMEGAGFWQKIFYVTLPRLRPIISMMLVLSTIGALQVFGPPFIMTRGGPGNATVTVALQVYRLAIEQFKLGEGTALSVILFFVVLVMIIFQRTYFKEDPDT